MAMTTKELSNALGVGETTVKRAVEELRPVLGEVLKNKQGGYLFNEEQATLIKQEIQKHHNLAKRQIDSVSTEYEENLVVLNALNILHKRLEAVTPKVEYAEAIMETEKILSIHDTAKELNQPGFGEINLYKFLRNTSVLMWNNIPYQQYIEQGYFRIVTKPFTKANGKKEVSHQTYTTPKGRVWILKKIKEAEQNGGNIANNKAGGQLAVSV